MTTDPETVTDQGEIASPAASGPVARVEVDAPVDYGAAYYASAHLGTEEEYSWESDHWRAFFRGVAKRIVTTLGPATVHDVGCARGLLVQALVELGVDATGSDISEYAVTSAHPDVQDRLTVATATAALPRRYDLVTCVEVLEHMPADEAQQAIDRLTAASDRLLISSTPADFREPTHINVQPTAHWASYFADRGFFRASDVDGAFLTPWALMLEKADPTRSEVVRDYETRLAPLHLELAEKRQALLEASRDIHDLERRLAQYEQGPRVVQADDATILAAHAELTARDHVIGLEASVQRLERQVARIKDRNRVLRKQVADADDTAWPRRLARGARARLEGERG